MTENEAFHAVGLLIGGVAMWPEAATDGFVTTFVNHADDAEAMIEVCDRIAVSWRDRAGRPSVGDVLDEYRRHPRVAAEREASASASMARSAGSTWCEGTGMIATSDGMRPCPRCNPYLADVYADPARWNDRYRAGTPLHELHGSLTVTHGQLRSETPMPPPCKRDTHHDPDRFVSAAEGVQRAEDQHRSMFGRGIDEPPVANPMFAAEIIEGSGHFDPYREVWTSTYSVVVDAFRGDHARARVSLKALGARLTHANNGNLTLRPNERPDEPGSPPQPPAQSPAPHGAAEPSPPSERPLSAKVLAEALGKTRRLMEEER